MVFLGSSCIMVVLECGGIEESLNVGEKSVGLEIGAV